MLPLYTLTLFVSSFLLFLVQPMVAKMLLRALGGSPAVWNTCMVFFQAALLAGYLAAHTVYARLSPSRQALLHLAVLTLALVALPIDLAAAGGPPTGALPVTWLLGRLTAGVGLPFFVVATTAPLLQRWFARTGHPAASDPYFLYAASNLGSLAALLSYPLAVEPRWRLAEQSWLWECGYGLLLALSAACALGAVRGSASPAQTDPTAEGSPPPSVGRRLRWVALAFAPSSLMLGVTTYLTTDIAAIPLLWVVPLALYLLSFVLVFTRRPPVPHWLVRLAVPVAVVPLAVVIVSRTLGPLWLVMPIHLLAFLIVAMACHGELAADRPPPRYLTGFYLWMAVGGVLGGLFNALVAPLAFTSVAEYPIALVAACLLMPRRRRRPGDTAVEWRDFALPAAVAGLAALGVLWLRHEPNEWALEWLPSADSVFRGLPVVALVFGLRPIRFGVALGALLLFALNVPLEDDDRILLAGRNFFGTHRVLDVERQGHFHRLVHGTTTHGLQNEDPALRREPLSYYYRASPVGQLFGTRVRPDSEFAVIGLGSGTLACYAGPGQRVTFYEIDPAIAALARDPDAFTYLSDCDGHVDVVLGDGRLGIARAPDGRYGIIVVDAFSSDAVPVHLLTSEALKIYLAKLAPGGVIAYHVSNRYLALEPVVGDLAGDAGLACIAQDQHSGDLTSEEQLAGKSPSHYVLVARRRQDFGRLTDDSRWYDVLPRPGARVWTDDYSNVAGVFSVHQLLPWR